MATYNTGNPVPSNDPRDLKDNMENLDRVVNSTGTWTDRLGVDRRTAQQILNDYEDTLNRYIAINYKGYHAPSTDYETNDVWQNPSDDTLWIVPVAYTSGVDAATDIANGDVRPHQDRDRIEQVVGASALSMVVAAYVGQSVHLSAEQQSGTFIWDNSDLSAEVAVDTLSAVYVAPDSDPTGASGAWVRELSGFLTPEMFGCVNDDGTDSHARLTAGIALADYLRMTFNFGSGKYLISAELELPFSVQIDAGSRASIEPYGVYTGTAISIGDGNGHRINMPSVSGFSTGAGLLLKGTNVAQINIKSISGCEDGVVLQTVAATHSTVLDCNVTVQQIGDCTNGIVFESDTYTNVMQGNYVYCNFISKTEYPVLFRDNGGHTQQAYWDSNRVETEAIDPINAGAAIILYNSTSYTVPRLRFYVNSWLGGFKSGDLLISGSFTGGDFLFSFAQAMDMDRIDPSSVDSIASCTIKICGGRNFGAGNPAFAETVDSSDYTTFNSGAPFYLGNNALMVTLPVDLADGESTVAPRCFHFLAKSSYMPHFSLDNMQLSPRAYIYAVPAGTEQDGMIRVGITNLSGGTLFTGQQWRCNLRVD